MFLNQLDLHDRQTSYYCSRNMIACGTLILSFILSGCATSRTTPLSNWWNGSSSPKSLASKIKAPSLISSTDKKVENPGLLHLKYARWQEELGNLVEARQSYEQALTSNPRSTDALIGLARINQLAGRNREAERGYTKALQFNPNNPQALDAIGQFYASQKRWDDTIDVLNKAMLAAPREPLYRFHLAVALTKQGNYDAAMPHFTHTVGEAEGHYNIGRILTNDGNLQQAEEHFLLALSKKPNLSEAQTMLEQVRHSLSDDVQVVSAEVPAEQWNQNPSSFLNGYQRGERLSAPDIPGRHGSDSVKTANFSSNQMGHSSAPSEMSHSYTRTQTAFSPPVRTGNNRLTTAQREQMQNQLRTQQ